MSEQLQALIKGPVLELWGEVSEDARDCGVEKKVAPKKVIVPNPRGYVEGQRLPIHVVVSRGVYKTWELLSLEEERGGITLENRVKIQSIIYKSVVMSNCLRWL